MSLRDRLERALELLWYRPLPSWWPLVLWPLGLLSLATLFGARRRRRRRRASPSLPTIAIGNLHVGGSGKTQIAIELCRRAAGKALHPAVVLRGYGGNERGPLVVGPDSELHRVGDEAILLAARCREAIVIVARDRALGAEYARSLGASIVFLDDGLQQTQLRPTRNVVVFPAESPLGNGHLLPLGPLREPLAAAPAERTVWVHGSGPGELPCAVQIRSVAHPVGFVVASGLGAPRSDIPARMFGFAGIARPERFWRSLESMGIELAGRTAFGDHRMFGAADLRELTRRATTAGATALCCTEKDAVRLSGLKLELPVYALRLDLRVLSGEAELEGLLAF
ncbi:MAG: tetraacyldisaccharide 4'-kinase [Deltaproteobacteria bacterium]